ncbi:hypothetical protein CYMTET_53443 [Cymbomonas tetramitiformis]|uniref:Uncharacterized protein n=1 Tax=Cymbomonas tetramitiformis TaxID=36881 RepID=A0AAE0BIE6_9CHLO|nr:hypothetical protein CYMTET_53443 [Cymbomonas tetramitiformis]
MKSVEYEILEGVTNPHQRAWKGGVRLTFIAGGTGSKSAYWKFKDAVGGTGYLKPAQVEEVKDDVDPPAATSDDESEPPEVSSPGSPINLSSGKNSPGSYDGNAAGVEEAEEAPATIASEARGKQDSDINFKQRALKHLLSLPILIVNYHIPGASDEMDVTKICRRPADVSGILMIHSLMYESMLVDAYRRDERLRSLPFEELNAFAGTTQARRVLLAGLAHVVGEAKLSVATGRDRKTIRRAQQAVADAADEIPEMLDQITKLLESKCDKARKKLAELMVSLESCLSQRSTLGSESTEDKQSPQEKMYKHMILCKEREIFCATPGSKEYRQLAKRMFDTLVQQSDKLKHAVRGHMPPIHITYPNFKVAAESIANELNARADPSRASITMHIEKSTWGKISALMNDPTVMEEFGGVIPVSKQTLKRHKITAEDRRQDREQDPGVLNLCSRKVGKILLPTEIEQPNGYAQNKAAKDLTTWAIDNLLLVVWDGRDDHSNLALDVVYNLGRLVQQTCDRKGDGWRYASNLDSVPKADGHDYNQGPGQKLVISTHQLHHLGTHTPPFSDYPDSLSYAPTVRSHVAKDGKLVVFVKSLKFQRSTAFQHAREEIYMYETFPELFCIQGTQIRKPVLVLTVDSGQDECVRFYGQVMSGAYVFLRLGIQQMILFTRAAGFTPLWGVEVGQGWITRILAGTKFTSSHYGKVARDQVGDPRTPDDALLERANHEYAVQQCTSLLDGVALLRDCLAHTDVRAKRAADLKAARHGHPAERAALMSAYVYGRYLPGNVIKEAWGKRPKLTNLQASRLASATNLKVESIEALYLQMNTAASANKVAAAQRRTVATQYRMPDLNEPLFKDDDEI